MDKYISQAVIRRMPRYYRYLGELLESGVERISSGDLSKLMKVTASQIRQDLNNFGGFGQQGYGYNVEELYNEIGKILGCNKIYNSILIGAGNLGQAIANYGGFGKAGFEIKALFDANPKMIGLKIRDIEVLDSENLENFLENNKQYWDYVDEELENKFAGKDMVAEVLIYAEEGYITAEIVPNPEYFKDKEKTEIAAELTELIKEGKTFEIIAKEIEEYKKHSDCDVIIADECQFLTPAQIDDLRKIVDELDIPVLCYGLRTDFLTKLFPGSLRLFEVADSITEIKTICACGKKAIVNARIDGEGKIVTEGGQILIGGNDSYVAMCHSCWKSAIAKQNKK